MVAPTRGEPVAKPAPSTSRFMEVGPVEDGARTWIRVPALIVSVVGLIALTLAVASSGAGADPGNGNGQGNGNACVTQGDDTGTPPAGCDTSRPAGHSQGKVCPENHPNGKRVPAVDKGLSPNRSHGKAVGGTEVVCASSTQGEPTTTTTSVTATTTAAVGGAVGGAVVPTQVAGVTVSAPGGAARAAPSELAFTGPLTSPGLLLSAGLALMALGAALFLLGARVPGLSRAEH